MPLPESLRTSVIITTHVNSDADGLGSGLALYHVLKQQGFSVRFLVDGTVSQTFSFLPGMQFIVSLKTEAEAQAQAQADTLLVVDTGEAKRIGVIEQVKRKETLIIDHHATKGEPFGIPLSVDAKASCTGKLVLALLDQWGIALDPTLANCLYAALCYDTGRFLHSNTGPEEFDLAARLVRAGADPAVIAANLAYNRSPQDLKLQSLALKHLKVDRNDPRLAGIQMPWKSIAKIGEPEDWGDLVLIPRSLRGVLVSYLLREVEREGKTVCRISLRSEPPVDIAQVAQALGGGGHRQAAGATFEGTLAQARRALIPRLRKALKAAGKRNSS